MDARINVRSQRQHWARGPEPNFETLLLACALDALVRCRSALEGGCASTPDRETVLSSLSRPFGARLEPLPYDAKLGDHRGTAAGGSRPSARFFGRLQLAGDLCLCCRAMNVTAGVISSTSAGRMQRLVDLIGVGAPEASSIFCVVNANAVAGKDCLPCCARSALLDDMMRRSAPEGTCSRPPHVGAKLQRGAPENMSP